MRRLLALVVLAVLAAGCEDYAETVSCGRGTVLNEDDECVAPPTPDGGVAIVDCGGLCDAVAAWDADQLTCLSGMLGSFGPPPAECMTDLTVVDSCNACVGAAGATDEICATAGSLCQ